MKKTEFFVLVGENTQSQALEILQQVYKDNTISCTRIFEWHKRFEEGRRGEGRKITPISGILSTNRSEVNVMTHSVFVGGVLLSYIYVSCIYTSPIYIYIYVIYMIYDIYVIYMISIYLYIHLC